MKVKQIYIVILLFASLLSINLNAQEIDEIIKKHIDAHGGQENWDAVKSMKITGNYTLLFPAPPKRWFISKTTYTKTWEPNGFTYPG